VRPGCSPRGFLSLGSAGGIRFLRCPSLCGGLWRFRLFSQPTLQGVFSAWRWVFGTEVGHFRLERDILCAQIDHFRLQTDNLGFKRRQSFEQDFHFR
jgi:hypothetical protein